MKVVVPVKRRFKLRLLLQVYGRWLGAVLLISFVVFLASPRIDDGPYKRLIVGGLAILALVPYALWETLLPAVFDITASAEHIDYEFANPDYATEFAELNREHLVAIDLRRVSS